MSQEELDNVVVEDVTQEELDRDAIWDEGFNEGYEAGEEEGYNNGIHSSVVEDMVEEARADGFASGLEREQQRIRSVIDMQMKWASEQNKGRDYIFWKNVRELLTPINFTPWSEERWQEELEKDGF